MLLNIKNLIQHDLNTEFKKIVHGNAFKSTKNYTRKMYVPKITHISKYRRFTISLVREIALHHSPSLLLSPPQFFEVLHHKNSNPFHKTDDSFTPWPHNQTILSITATRWGPKRLQASPQSAKLPVLPHPSPTKPFKQIQISPPPL